MKRTALAISMALVLVLAPVAKAKDIVETAVGSQDFQTLVAAVKAAGLVETLQGKGPFTVFAPTDEAFSKIPKKALQDLLKPENKDKLTAILTYHVVPGDVRAKDAIKLSSATTVNGQRLDIRFSNGKLQVDNATVVAADIECDNGVIHVIDTVMLPSTQTIPEIAQEAGSFGTLLAAAQAAGLAEVLGTKGPFTVFAPTDEAFGKLPKGTVETLLKPENKAKLAGILKYHVLPGRVYSDGAVEAGMAKTLQGQPVKAGLGSSGLKINDSNVIKADIEAANGVIHVIDAVLLPKQLSTSDARRVLEGAVARGSRLFNRGDSHGCYDVYQKACQELVAAGESLPDTATAVLRASLGRAAEAHSESEKAWILRHGIDLAYYSLH